MFLGFDRTDQFLSIAENPNRLLKVDKPRLCWQHLVVLQMRYGVPIRTILLQSPTLILFLAPFKVAQIFQILNHYFYVKSCNLFSLAEWQNLYINIFLFHCSSSLTWSCTPTACICLVAHEYIKMTGQVPFNHLELICCFIV